MVMSSIPESGVSRDQTPGSNQNNSQQNNATAQAPQPAQAVPVVPADESYDQSDAGSDSYGPDGPEDVSMESPSSSATDPNNHQDDPTWSSLESQSTLELQLIYSGLQQIGRLLDVRV
jgi:hypothetical protein